MKTLVRKALTGISRIVAGILFVVASAGLSVARADEAPNPYALADSTWITISGTVDSVERDRFILDYGDGVVIVEMDDGDRDADAYKLLTGDEVTVAGRIDDDFLETTTIEASSVYIDSIGTTFFASAVDDETSERLAAAVAIPVQFSRAEIQGTVMRVSDHEFTVDAGSTDVIVDVSDMVYDPLDDEGYLKVEAGDRVKVAGDIDSDLFTGYEIDADSIVKLNM
jgi:uncharacterized protein YdeI (BOF family)